MKTLHALAAAAALTCAIASAQTKWDMPTPYPAANFHTENITQFAADVDKATNGKLKITVHSNASLLIALGRLGPTNMLIVHMTPTIRPAHLPWPS